MGVWQDAGATINLVGSLKTGLLVKHRDIDFHIYATAILTLSTIYMVRGKWKQKRI